jgi:cell wall-associated NlpC family hydrolase
MSATGGAIYNQARSYLNVPFAPNGRDAQGLDCGGLLLRVAADLGLAVPDVPHYQPGLAHGEVSHFLEPFCDRIDVNAPLSIYHGVGVEPGDFLVFSLAKAVQHLGIARGAGSFIHSWDCPSVHRVCETPLDSWWRGRLIRVYRARGFTSADAPSDSPREGARTP